MDSRTDMSPKVGALFPVGLHGLAEEDLVHADLAGVFGGFEGGHGEGG